MKIYILIRSSSFGKDFPVGVYSSQQMVDDALEAYAYDYLSGREESLYIVQKILDTQPDQFA